MGNFVQTCMNNNKDSLCTKDNSSLYMGTGGSFRGTEPDAQNDKYSIRTDPVMKSDIYKMLTTYKQKHLFDHFVYLTQTEKEQLIDHCGTIDFVVEDFIFHQLIKKSIGTFVPPQGKKEVKDLKDIANIVHNAEHDDTCEMGRYSILNNERYLISCRGSLARR